MSERRKDRERECSLRTQKKALKRKMKKEKKRVIKEGAKEAEKILKNSAMVNDGTFLEKVKEKYGSDVMVKGSSSEEEESNSYDSEVDHSSD